MPTRSQFRHEDIAAVPRGWKVRTKAYPDGHEVRIAFPPGRRKTGAGKLISILHPNREKNGCNGFGPVRHKLLTNQIILSPEFVSALTQGLGLGAGSYVATEAARGVLKKKKKENKKRNPGSIAEAERLREDFTGLPAGEIIDAQEAHMQEGAYTVIGDLLTIWLAPVEGDPNGWPSKPTINFDDTYLAVDPKDQQLYIVGGDQSLDESYLESRGIPLDTDLVALGLAHGIAYRTAKSFDGGVNREYAHRLGEESGIVPTLYYNRKLEKMYLVGGNYSIAPVREDINASPGIVD